MALFSRSAEIQPPTPVVMPSATPSGIDIPAAIQAHVGWKIKLQRYLNGTYGEPLDAQVVGADDRCTLGHWIHGEGEERYGHHPLFQEIKTIHAAFHRCAGSVVQCVDHGERERAAAILNQGDFPRYSGQIKSKLAALCLELEF